MSRTVTNRPPRKSIQDSTEGVQLPGCQTVHIATRSEISTSTFKIPDPSGLWTPALGAGATHHSKEVTTRPLVLALRAYQSPCKTRHALCFRIKSACGGRSSNRGTRTTVSQGKSPPSSTSHLARQFETSDLCGQHTLVRGNARCVRWWRRCQGTMALARRRLMKDLRK